MRLILFLLWSLSFFSQNEFSLKKGSKHYNVQFQVEKCEESTCQGKANIQLISKKSNKIIQKFESEDLYFYLDSLQKPSVNIVELYGEQSPFIFDDFNFDGTEDLAIRNGNLSAYSGPSYDVYVYHKNKKKFVLSRVLTDLVYENLGMFKVDAIEKKIIVFSKSGCCWHKTEEYKVEVQKGLYLIRVFIEDATIGDEKVEVIERKLIKGKWVENREIHRIEEYYTD